MKVLLNASNLRFGGGITVGLNLIGGLLRQRPEYHFFLLHPEGLGYDQFGVFSNVTLYPMPDKFHSSVFHKFWYNDYKFARLCKLWNIDKVVSLGNIGFPAKGRPQLLFIQMPHLVYPESAAWKKMNWESFLKNSLVDQYASLHLRYATLFAVQTEVMKARLCSRFDIPAEKVTLLPNAADNTHPAIDYSPSYTTGLKLLFLSKYYPHKNFECLIPLAKIIRDKSLPITITITISARESPGAANILKMVRDESLDEIILNINHVPYEKLGDTLCAHNGLFLPALLESSSGAYAEALKYGIPIFTSHYDFATANLGDAAFYFDPLNPEQIANVLMRSLGNQDHIEEKRLKGQELAKTIPGWEEISGSFAKMIDQLS